MINKLFATERAFRKVFDLRNEDDVKIKHTAARECVNIYTTATYYDSRRHDALCACGLDVMCIYVADGGLMFTVDYSGV